MQKNLLLSIIMLFSWHVLRSQEIVSQSSNDSISVRTVPDHKALLWEITGNGLTKPSYIYGALETNQKLAYHLIDSFFIALKQVDGVILELHPDSVRKAMQNPDILKRVYKRILSAGYQPSYDYYGILQPQQFDKELFEVILSGYGMMMGQEAFTEMEEEKTLNEFVYMAALKLGKKVTGLSSYPERLDLQEKAEKVMREDQKKQKNIREDYNEYRQLVNRCLEAYRKGDLGTLDTLYRQLVSSPGLFAQVLDPQAQLNAVRIAEMVKDGGSHLVIMDATMMGGKNGVIEGLRSAGFTLQPIRHYILTRPNKEKEKLERMTKSIKLVPYRHQSDFWEIKVPDYTLGGTDELRIETHFRDDLNDVTYSVNRYATNAQLASRLPEDLFASMDSVIFEYVPGKIIKRSNFEIQGYPGVEVLNRTSRGNLEQFKLVITPLEVIVFKVSGPRGYLKKKGIGKLFMQSVKINLPKETAWKTVTTGHGEFSLSLPPYHIIDTSSNRVFVNPGLAYQGWDPATSSWFLFSRNLHHDLLFLEEDTFDLNYMAEQIARRMKKEVSLSPAGSFQGYPAVDFNLFTKGIAGDTLNARLLLRGAAHYLLLAKTKNPLLSEKFFSGFTLMPFEYVLKGDTVADTTLYYTVVSEVQKQESDTPDEEMYYGWMDEDDEEEDDSFESEIKRATYYYDRGGEFIEVSRLKAHDFMYYANYNALWTSLIKKATNDSDLVVSAVLSDSMATFPWLDITLSDTNSIRQIRKKFIIHHGLIYTISTMSSSIDGEQPFTSTFFATFTPNPDSLIGKSLFEDQGMQFIRNYLSTDTMLVKQAIKSMDMVRFTMLHHDSLRYLLSRKDLLQRNLSVATALIEAYGKLESKKYLSSLEVLYNEYQGNPILQLAVFRALAFQKFPEARKAMLSIMASDIPLAHNYTTITSMQAPLRQTNAYTQLLFPEITKYTRYPEYESLINGLMLYLVQQKKLDLKNEPKIMKELNERIMVEIKRRKEDNQRDKGSNKPEENEEQYTSLLDHDEEVYELDEIDGLAVTEFTSGDDEDETGMDYVADETELFDSELIVMLKIYSLVDPGHKGMLEIYHNVLGGVDRNEALSLALHLQKTGIEVHDSIWRNFARSEKIRADLYYLLEKQKALHLFDSASRSQELIARSFLVNSDDISPKDSLTMIGRRYVSTGRKAGYVYFFKHKSGYGSNKEWVISYAGIQPVDTAEICARPDFVKVGVDKIFVGDNLEEVMDKHAKGLRKMYRKRFSGMDEDMMMDFEEYSEEFEF